MSSFFNSFRGASVTNQESAPTGEIATSIIEICTNPAAPDVDWPTVFVTIEIIKGYYSTATPQEGCAQAIKAIRYRLDCADPVILNYTLEVLSSFYTNCEKPFAVEVARKENLAYLQKFLERQEIAPENRAQLLEMIGEWATTTDTPPPTRKLFESLLRSRYRFPEEVYSKLKPGEYEKIMSETNTANASGGILGGNLGSIFKSNQSPPPPLPDRPPQPFNQVMYPVQRTQSFNQAMRPVHPTRSFNQAPSTVPPKNDIDQVDFNEREKWVSFDVNVAESCAAMLQETLLHLPQNLDSDLDKHDIAYEGFMRCCDIQGRIVAAIPKVKEPKLVKRLLVANHMLTDVMGQYNDARDSYWKRFIDFEYDISDIHQFKGAKTDAKGKGKAQAAEESQKETSREEFQKLEEFQLLEGVPGPSSLAKLKVEE
ncbi:hypothetical protein HDU79_007544 [Rhizoclosmatium sp. JEL0117]|nr:hypothetical protein HDU79_007544 [Rhizoclosmatium sp. JEL0117]